MPFVNEKISDENIKKYGIEEIDNEFNIGHFEPQWTVNRDLDVYLRRMYSDRELKCEIFSFYWKGTLLRVRLARRGEGVRGGKGSTTWSIIPTGSPAEFWLPKQLEEKRSEIIADLKEALSAYKDFGVYSTIADHTAYFDF